ncbi:Glycosyl transferase [Senna tora]|uniref:Glycosyl transferase n=1 Tax=Senna tora TaxID=362788 RepID=A0A834T8X3_9FABA|nr:Glycosyl transferase [Senna tora]
MTLKQSNAWMAMPKNKWAPMLLLLFSLSTVMVVFMRATSDSCDTSSVSSTKHFGAEVNQRQAQIHSTVPLGNAAPSPLEFMKSKLVLMVSHELSLSGGPLLLMELAFLLRGVGSDVVWITNQKPEEPNEVIYSLENKMLDRGVQVLPANGEKAIDTALKADLVILNTAVAGKWLDPVLKEKVPQVLPKVLWWIHEMRGHYFKKEYVKHLPFVAGAMIDSHVTAELWKNRTRERLGIKMPDTYVVHLGNSKELMEIAENSIAKRVLREHVRESLGVRNDDLLFAIINSILSSLIVTTDACLIWLCVSRGKGQDLFLRSFHESLKLIQEKKLQVPKLHALVVGSDMNAHTTLEIELRKFAVEKKIQDRVHFINKTLTVAPYLASIDVLVQNSQGRGECFGRITIEAMAFHLPVLGTTAGGTKEIMVNGTTGLLHPVGKEGVTPLANNIVKLATHVERRLTMGKKGYDRVKEMFLEHHMAHRIALALKEVLQKAKRQLK